ncbi:hypothetical protein ACFL12_00810 [Pseudomonadota bacterium]
MLSRRHFNHPVHDPKHGIDPANVADKLDQVNWTKRAVCRTDGHDHYYVYIDQPLRDDGTPDPERYFIMVFNLYRHDYFGQQWRTHFPTLKEALNYANGEDQSDFAKQTWPDTPPPRSGPKPKSDIAKSVQAAAKALEKELKNRPSNSDDH